MRGMTRRWSVRQTQTDAEWINGLDLPPLVRRVLLARGFSDPHQIERFCEPRLSHLHDPVLLHGADAAAARIIDAVRREQVIVIYGDYDVDGITATAILYHTIKTVAPAARIRTYVPHRLEEGYGLNSEALRQLKADGADLVVTVDCGISAIEPANVARDIGLDLIITDHHELQHPLAPGSAGGSHLPHALAIVHPRLPASNYPFADLCGAGVAFKLAWRFATLWCNSQRVSDSLQKTLLNMLPLVALGTIADVVPLVDENRVMTAFGLRLIKQTPLVGLRALIEASGLMDEKIDAEKVGFALAPRLNACGRMGHAADAVRMLTEASPDEAMAIARTLTEVNQHRQGVERHIFEHACRMAEDAGMTSEERRIIVLAHESWHPGVVGIVCSRLVERFARPTILLQRGRNVCKGSARSVDGYSIHEALTAASEHLITCGGHAMAAGLSLHPDRLAAFTDALTLHANARIGIDQLTPTMTIDCSATLDELDMGSVQRLHALSPFGRANRAPTLQVSDVVVAEAPRQIGANGRHLSVRLRQNINGQWKWMRCVWWGAGSHAGDLAAGMRLDIAIEPRINTWNGQTNVEAELQDVRVCEAVVPA
jgi:single-stranded-DNA-specific exonuclease